MTNLNDTTSGQQRRRLNGLITEYLTLRILDRDETAPRRYQLRAQVSRLAELMGPAESARWTETIGEYETVAEYEIDAEAERQKGLRALAALARGEWVSDGERSFIPPG